MTDTTSCPACGAQLPAAAAFCTSCGSAVASAPVEGAPPAPDASPPSAAPPAPPSPAFPPPAADDTAVSTPGLNDPTQVQPGAAPPPPPAFEAPSAPWSAAEPATTPPSAAPWAPPADATPAPPAGTPWNPPGSAEPAPPAPGAPTGWPPGPPAAPASPAGPPYAGGPTYAGAPGAGSWGTPGAQQPWGTAPAETGAAASSTSSGRRPSVIGGLVALFGALLVLGGLATGWVTIESGERSDTIAGFALTSGDEVLKSNDPFLIVAFLGIGFLASFALFLGLARPVARAAAALAGIAIVAVAAINWSSIASFVTDNFSSDVEASTAVGFYLAIAGGVVLALAALMPAKKS